jgi:hypothetical protein
VLLGHAEDGCGLRLGVLNQDVDLAVTQLADESGVNFPYGLGFVDNGMVCLQEQINVAAFELVIGPRTKQYDLRALAQHGGRGAFDGVNLVGCQAHVVDFVTPHSIWGPELSDVLQAL